MTDLSQCAASVPPWDLCCLEPHPDDYGPIDVEIIERNSIRCDSCGDEIESTHRHDFVTCGCGRVHADGGREYRKRGWQGDGGPTYTDTSIYTTETRTYNADGQVIA